MQKRLFFHKRRYSTRTALMLKKGGGRKKKWQDGEKRATEHGGERCELGSYKAVRVCTHKRVSGGAPEKKNRKRQVQRKRKGKRGKEKDGIAVEKSSRLFPLPKELKTGFRVKKAPHEC